MLRGGAAGIGHVDMRIGTIGDQRVGVFNHLRRHIGMQVETGHQRQVLADHLAHALEKFAFAVVEMLGHHRAVQIEIDRIQWPGGGDAIDHDLDDAFVGIPGHVRARGGGTGNGRNQLPAIDLGLLDKASQADIDVAHDPEHIGALRHRRPAAAMHEIIVSRLRRREGVGLVQEAANGDTDHGSHLN